MLLLFLLIIIILLCFATVIGSGEYLYHGSYIPIEKLEPRPSNAIDSEKAVFATPEYISAVIFSGQWTDFDFSFGRINKTRYLCEQYPDALNKFDRTGYIHYLDKSQFKQDDRLPSSELISYDEVVPVKIDEVNVKKEVEKAESEGKIKIIRFEKLLENINKNVPEKIKFKVKEFYVYADPYATKPKGKFYRHIHDIKEDSDIISVYSNIGEIKGVLIEPECEKKYLVLPKKRTYSSPKTSNKEYRNFLDARKLLYKDYEIIYS